MNIFKLILKWKFHLLVLVIASVILSALFSSKLFIKPLYKSFAIVYPSNIFPYSDESETEQMLQLMNSSSIRDSVIHKFDLGAHWGLNKQDEHYVSNLLYLYGNRVNIRKTEFESVVVNILDTDPKIACDMVKAVLSYYDLKVKNLQKIKFHEVVLNYREILEKKRKSLDSIQTVIEGLTGTEVKTPMANMDPLLMKSFMDKMDNKVNKEREIKRMKPKAAVHDNEMVLLSSLAMSEALAYSELKLKYDQAMLNDNRNYTYTNLVVDPYVSDKQAFPKPWLIITFSVLAAFFLSLVVISFIENRKLKVNQAASIPNV
ncbi:MAG: hypothetical protein NTU44_03110 [Bacteroidetes bacterium]|nr:hypothetical protein [Bacteroidota bacterium]